METTPLMDYLLMESARAKLKSAAKLFGFIPELPRIPAKITKSSLMGYHKRMTNWIDNLNKAEYQYRCDHPKKSTS